MNRKKRNAKKTFTLNTAVLLVFLFKIVSLSAQEAAVGKEKSVAELSWRYVATQMPPSWYASSDAATVAETVLLCQKDIGGWEKNKPYHHPLTDTERVEVKKKKAQIGATIDNGATTTEMIFLANVYAQQKEERYRKAFERGLHYLLEAQYENGGWPQFYPLRKGYYTHITYNDNAMVNLLQLLKNIAEGKSLFAQLPLTSSMKQKAGQAYSKGIDCILNTQIIVDGKPTVWCAQHDEQTLLPANARAYELASFSGAESIGIVQLLMNIKDPSQKVIDAVNGAMSWMNDHKITGVKVVTVTGTDGKRDREVMEDQGAVPLLARFYDLQTGKPFFCDRDGVKKSSLAEIGWERRNGYSWYSTGLPQLQVKYREWLNRLKNER